MTQTNSISTERRERLQAALQAARKAGNPYMERSIIAALTGRSLTAREAMGPLHPEIEEVLFPEADDPYDF